MSSTFTRHHVIHTPTAVLAPKPLYTRSMGKTRKYVNQDHMGLRVRELRVARDWTQADLREEIQRELGESVGINFVTTLERDGTSPTVRVAVALAKVLNCSLDYLACLTDDPSPTAERDQTLPFISPEAEKVASGVDDLPAEFRSLVVALTEQAITTDAIRRQRETETYLRTLKLIEDRFGVQERRRIELALERAEAPLSD